MDLIFSTICFFGGLTNKDIAKRLVYFGADGDPVFQGVRASMIAQITKRHAPYMLGIHYVGHCTNLAAKTLSNLPMVSKVEELLEKLVGFFGALPKRYLEFQLLAEALDSEGLKILGNVKTRWISMFQPSDRVCKQYKPLVAKMHSDVGEGVVVMLG